MSGNIREAHYHDLDAVLEKAWGMMIRGASDRRAGFHTAQVATVGAAGAPSIRSVVLRRFDRVSRTLRFHSDARSGKIGEIRHRPRIAVHLYDQPEKVQLRLTCHATVHHGDEIASKTWQGLQAMSRECYEQAAAPGTALETPSEDQPMANAETAAAFANFAVITGEILSLEWLYLSVDGHRRARFDWRDGREKRMWLAP